LHLDFLARPLGGIIFGHIGDISGRKAALKISILMMGISTMLIGFIPTYARIGLAAPIILLILRIFQGIAAGGELVSSTTYLYETAPQKRKYFFCSLVTCSSMSGVLLGSIVASVMYHFMTIDALERWGWRLSFELGMISVIFAFWIRKNIVESGQFQEIKEKIDIKRSPVRIVLKKSFKSIIHVGLMNMFVSINFYLLFVWMPSYLQIFLLKPAASTLLINSLALAVLIVFTPLSGLVADKIGEKFAIIASTLSIFLLVYPLFLLLRVDNLWIVLLVQVIFAICLSSIEGILSASMAKRFPVQLRLSGLGISYNISTSLFGGTAPLICSFLIKKTSFLSIPAVYIIIICLIALPIFYFQLNTPSIIGNE